MTRGRKATIAYLGYALAALAMLATFAYAFASSLRYGVEGHERYGWEVWKAFLRSAGTPHLIGNTLVFCLLNVAVVVPLALTATLGLRALKSTGWRLALWGVLALPLCLGQTVMMRAVRHLFGIIADPLVDSNALFVGTAWSRLPVTYAVAMTGLPLLTLAAVLADARYRMRTARLVAFVTAVSALWALANAVASPEGIFWRMASSRSNRYLDTFNTYIYFRVLGNAIGTSAPARLIAQGIGALLYAAMAWAGWRILSRGDGDARLHGDATRTIAAKGGARADAAQGTPAAATPRNPRLAWLLAPALLFMLVPMIHWVVRQIPHVLWSNAGIPFPILPTALSAIACLLAIPLGVLLASVLRRGGRAATACAAMACMACGVFLSQSVALILRSMGWTGDNALVSLFVFSLNPMLVALLASLCAPVGLRNDEALPDDVRAGRRAGWFCAAGIGCIAMAMVLGSNWFVNLLTAQSRELYTVPAIQDNIAQEFAWLFPQFSLLLLAIGAAGVALLARGLRAGEAKGAKGA